jgi:hypothetical protein
VNALKEQDCSQSKSLNRTVGDFAIRCGVARGVNRQRIQWDGNTQSDLDEQVGLVEDVAFDAVQSTEQDDVVPLRAAAEIGVCNSETPVSCFDPSGFVDVAVQRVHSSAKREARDVQDAECTSESPTGREAINLVIGDFDGNAFGQANVCANRELLRVGEMATLEQCQDDQNGAEVFHYLSASILRLSSKNRPWLL